MSELSYLLSLNSALGIKPRWKSIVSAILASASPALPPITPAVTWLANFDFTDTSTMTFSSGIGAAGSVLASIKSIDGVYTATTVSGAPTLVLRNGRLVTFFSGNAGLDVMQVSSAMGLATAASTSIMMIFEPATNIGTGTPFDCSVPANAYFSNRYMLQFGSGTSGVTGYKSDGGFQSAQIDNSILIGGTGPRIFGIRGQAGTTDAQVMLDGATPVAGTSAGAAPSGMTTFTIGCQASSSTLSAYADMYVTRLDIASAALTNDQLSQYNTWVWSKYPEVYAKPLAGAVIQHPVIDAGSFVAGAAVTWTVGQMAGYPAPTATYLLYKNGISTGSTTSGSYSSTVNSDVLSLVQTATNSNGAGSNTSLPVIIGQSAISPVITGIGVQGQPLGVFIPTVSSLASAYQWYSNAVSAQNFVGQQPISGATSSTYTPTSSDVAGGAIFSCEITLPDGTRYATSEFGNTQIQLPGLSPAIVQKSEFSPSTATRPSYSTGIGFFSLNGSLYDANGVRFRQCGVNASHYDTATGTGVYTHSKSNAVRIGVTPAVDWTTGSKPNMDAAIANKIVPIPTFFYADASFVGGISGNVLTVTAMNVGNMSKFMNLQGIGLYITDFGTGTGKTGTYILNSTGSVTPGTTIYASTQTTGSSEITVLESCVQSWIDQAANWQTYERYQIINIANEWGAVASVGDTTWRDAYVAQVPLLRAAGYKGTLQIDAGGSGQDTYGILHHAAAILAADPQHNCVFSLHIYGFFTVGGSVAEICGQLYNLGATQGIPCTIGEFGPGFDFGSSPTMVDGLEVMTAADANRLGWTGWAFDDHFGSSSPPALNNSFCMVYDWYTGYSTGASSDLTDYGLKTLLDPIRGVENTAVPATIF